MYLSRLAQVHDGGDGRRDAEARGNGNELVVPGGRREGRGKRAIDPGRACTRLGERGMHSPRPVAHGCHAHARVVGQSRVLDEREGVPFRLRYPRQANVHVARAVRAEARRVLPYELHSGAKPRKPHCLGAVDLEATSVQPVECVHAHG
eukprot:scaffold108219_cov44-Phaeocystis_antarctica.AAC.1